MTERSVFWANHLKAIDAEGISVRAYAAREGLAIQSLYQWRQKLGQTQRSHGADRVSVSSGFVAVKVTETLVSESATWTLRVGGIELELPAHPDAHWLVGVVEALAQRSP
jgi:transposase-like protein